MVRNLVILFGVWIGKPSLVQLPFCNLNQKLGHMSLEGHFQVSGGLGWVETHSSENRGSPPRPG